MRIDIRMAALAEYAERHVFQAAARLRVFDVVARIQQWDGTRCDLLVAAADDAYGFQVLELALKRGMPAIALGEPLDTIGIEALPARTSPSDLAHAIRQRLQLGKRVPAAPAASAAPVAAAESVLCQLATPELRGKPVDLSRNGRALLLRPKAGRIFAPSHSDLLFGLDNLHKPGWNATVVDPDARFPDTASRSLESFLLRAAYNAETHLPLFPDGNYRLEAWPDLGALPSLLCALHVSNRLVQGGVGRDELIQAQREGTAGKVNACLWAFAAANLLMTESADKTELIDIPKPASARVEQGVWKRIARRFGLLAGA